MISINVLAFVLCLFFSTYNAELRHLSKKLYMMHCVVVTMGILNLIIVIEWIIKG